MVCICVYAAGKKYIAWLHLLVKTNSTSLNCMIAKKEYVLSVGKYY